MTEPRVGNPDVQIKAPPERLYGVLSGVVAVEKYDGQPVGRVLAIAVKETNVDLRGTWSVAHSAILELMSDAKCYVRDRSPQFTGSPHQTLFDGLDDILSNVALNEAWKAARAKLSPLVMIALPFSAHQVRPVGGVAGIPAAESESIRKDVSALVDRVISSDWPVEFKAELLHVLGDLSDRLIRFEVFGPEGVRRASTSIVGTLIVNQAAARSNTSLVKEAVDLVAKVEDVFLKGYTIVQVMGGTLKKLLGPSE